MSSIETSGLTKRYGDIAALDGLDLAVRDGEVFGFLGPNGAGKSTTINLLLGFLTPSDGSGTVLGYDIESESRRIRQHIGLLPAGYSAYGRVIGREHLAYAIETKDATDDPDTLLDRTGLEMAARDRPAGESSKEMRQRLALAMALVGDPDLLVLDEPSSGLDPAGMGDLRTLIREEAGRGTTVVFSSHLLSEVEAVCDRVAILREGRLATVDTVDGLRTTMETESTVTLDVATAPAVDLTEIAGVADVTSTGSQLRVACTDPAAKAVVIQRIADTTTVRDVSIDDASLEDLFETITDGRPSEREPSSRAQEART